MGLLRIKRKYLELEVRCNPDKVSITPVAYLPQFADTAKAIARSEEMVTTMHLKYIHSGASDQYLKNYFRRKGWEVEQQELPGRGAKHGE